MEGLGEIACQHDLTIVSEGLVSVTPLHLDLTAYQAMEDLSARLSGSRANGADRS